MQLRQWAGQKFHTAAKYKQHPTTDYTAMRGPTPAARQTRQYMQQEMENRLRPWLRDLHLNEAPDLPTITIFVDGSFTGAPGTTQHHQAAGWGIHIPQLNISSHDKVITDNTHHPSNVGGRHASLEQHWRTHSNHLCTNVGPLPRRRSQHLHCLRQQLRSQLHTRHLGPTQQPLPCGNSTGFNLSGKSSSPDPTAVDGTDSRPVWST